MAITRKNKRKKGGVKDYTITIKNSGCNDEKKECISRELSITVDDKIEYTEETLQYALKIIKEGEELSKNVSESVTNNVIKSNRNNAQSRQLITNGHEILHKLAIKLIETAFNVFGVDILKNTKIVGTDTTLYNYFIVECVKRWLYSPNERFNSYLPYDKVLSTSKHPCIYRFYKKTITEFVNLTKQINKQLSSFTNNVKNKFKNSMKSIYEFTRKTNTNHKGPVNAINQLQKNLKINFQNESNKSKTMMDIMQYTGKLHSIVIVLIDGYGPSNREWWANSKGKKGRILAECAAPSDDILNDKKFELLVEELQGKSNTNNVLTPAHALMLIDLAIPSHYLNNALFQVGKISFNDFLVKHIIYLWKKEPPTFSFNILIRSAKHRCTHEIINSVFEDLMDNLPQHLPPEKTVNNNNTQAINRFNTSLNSELVDTYYKKIVDNKMININPMNLGWKEKYTLDIVSKFIEISKLIAYGYVDVNHGWFTDEFNSWVSEKKIPIIKPSFVDRLLCGMNHTNRNKMNINDKNQHAREVLKEYLGPEFN